MQFGIGDRCPYDEVEFVRTWAIGNGNGTCDQTALKSFYELLVQHKNGQFFVYHLFICAQLEQKDLM